MRTPTRVSVGWPSRTAHTTAVIPAARNARPRTVRPERASRTGPLGDRHRVPDALEDARRRTPAHGRLDAGQESVGEHVRGEPEDVVGENVVATLDRRRRLRRA